MFVYKSGRTDSTVRKDSIAAATPSAKAASADTERITIRILLLVKKYMRDDWKI